MSRALIVEITGPAGSGKSTLAATIARRAEHASVSLPPDPRAWRNLPFYARNLVASLPVLARMGLPTLPEAYLSREPVASVVVLNGWSARLRTPPAAEAPPTVDRPSLILLDQGPLYLLAELHRRGPRGLLRQGGWWETMYTRWAGVLDCVVRLDADDAVLIPRIRTRESAHRIKQMTDRESRRFLSQRRGSMSYILAHVVDRSPGLRVLSHDTSSRSTEALAELLLHELGEE